MRQQGPATPHVWAFESNREFRERHEGRPFVIIDTRQSFAFRNHKSIERQGLTTRRTC